MVITVLSIDELQIGCRLPWDIGTSIDLPICSKPEQFRWPLSNKTLCWTLSPSYFNLDLWKITLWSPNLSSTCFLTQLLDLWRMLINGCSSWFFSRSPKKPAVCPLAPILSTGSRSQWKLWTRFGGYLLNSKGLLLKRTCFASLNTNFIDHILFSRDQRINLGWCYGTPPPTCWWRGSPCSTPSSPWSPSSGAPSASSLASPSWLSGMERKCSLKCPYPHSWQINRLTFSLDKFCHIFIASCFK